MYRALYTKQLSRFYLPNRVYKSFKSFRSIYTAQKMVDIEPATQIGQVRTLADSELELELELPASKRPRIDVLELSEVEKLKKPSAKRERKREARLKRAKEKLPEPCSPADILWHDIVTVLGKDAIDAAIEEGIEYDSPFERQEEVELEVKILGSNGDGIAVSTDPKTPWVVIVPLALPQERVRARVYRHARLHSFGDLLEVITPNPTLRDSSRIRCKYFGSCAGCQYQMLSYETQLEFKRDVVVKAFKNYSNISQDDLPPILSTVPSPLQYEYRTKLTPHFEGPPKEIRKGPRKPSEGQPNWLHIGFNKVGTQTVMDIEECPIATPIINAHLGPTRENIIKNSHTYSKGVSLLFRESLDTSVDIDSDSVDRLSEAFNKQICVTDSKSSVRERVGNWIFEYSGGSFFQNNNSVLLPLTNYVRDTIFPPSASEPSTLTHLVDTYCGAGLFAIVLSPDFETVAGIELSQDSIRSATRNAEINKIPKEKISFRSGNAGEIFAAVGDFPSDRTAVLIDPPRKGCDEFFIKQLLEFGPKTIVYVSCNVHTQARDVGRMLEGARYQLESIRGFDLFPQTAHVESVAVLRRKL